MMMMINKWSLPDLPPAPPRAKALLEREKEPEPEPEPVEFRRTNTAGELIHGPEPKPKPPPKPIASNDPSKVETLRLRVEAAEEAPPPPLPIHAALQAYRDAADALLVSMKVDIVKDGYIEVPFAGQGEERWAGGGGRLGYSRGGYQDGQTEEARAANAKLDSYARERKEFQQLDSGRALPKTISGVLTDIWNDTIERLNVEVGGNVDGADISFPRATFGISTIGTLRMQPHGFNDDQMMSHHNPKRNRANACSLMTQIGPSRVWRRF